MTKKCSYLPILISQANKDMLYIINDSDFYEEVVDDNLSLFRDMISHEIVGVQLKNVRN
jgi:hypothetical protein